MRGNRSAGIAILLLIAAVYTLLSFWTPWAYDDWMFMGEWRDVNGNSPLSPRSLLDFWKSIRLVDNGRIANALAPLSTLFSPWRELFPLITGLWVAFTVAVAARFSFGGDALRQKAPAFYITVAWLALTVLLPWRNALFVADYALNYIWGTGVTLLFMALTVRWEEKGWNAPRLATALFMAFLAGGWHEGFAVATLCGFLLLTVKGLSAGRRFSLPWYIIGIAYAGVTLAFALCPGLIDRMQRQVGESAVGMSWLKMAVDFLPVVLLAACVFFTAVLSPLRPLLREAWGNRWFVIGCGVVTAGCLISLLFTHQPRSAFWPDLMATVMIFILTRPVWRGIATSRLRGYVTLVALAGCLLPLSATLVWQFRLYRESEEIMAKMEASETGTVFHDVIQPEEIPLLSLKMTNYPAWITDYQYQALKNYTKKPTAAVVPTSLEYMSSPGVPEPLEGNDGAWRVGNEIVMPWSDCAEPETVAAEVTLTDGATVPTVAMLLPFVSGDGARMIYVRVQGCAAGDVAGISFQP